MRMFEVGGCLRDEALGRPCNDVDFAVEAPSFAVMKDSLIKQGFKVFVENPEFVTLRAKVPTGNRLRERTDVADFVLCRKDGPSSDGRRPDFVQAGTIEDDLARRDFTMNAMARDVMTGEIIDPFDGMSDIDFGIIRFVGNPLMRIKEDGLRVLRAFRFAVTLDFIFAPATNAALMTEEAAAMLAGVAVERVDAEVRKMFTPEHFRTAIGWLDALPDHTFDAIFRDGLRLIPTLKEK